ncbi:MAG: branched-chain amino acid ABC transporter permease [Candidatus Competibacterales bacterium]
MIQLLWNSLVSGAIIALPAIAFTLLFGILRFPNFAVGAFVTVGAYGAWVANVAWGWPLVAAASFAAIATAGGALAADRVVFRPLRRRQAVTLLVVSIALALIVENLVRLAAGSDIRGFDVPLTRPMRLGDLRVTHDQLAIVATAMAACLAVHLGLTYTRLGKALWAVADNPTLASVRGIAVEGVTTAAVLTAGALLGLAGVLAGLELVIEPLVGWYLTIPVFAAAILGGIGSPVGAMVGAFLVGLAEEATAVDFDPAYKIGVGFIIIAVLLLVRPQGLFGRPEIKK